MSPGRRYTWLRIWTLAVWEAVRHLEQLDPRTDDGAIERWRDRLRARKLRQMEAFQALHQTLRRRPIPN